MKKKPHHFYCELYFENFYFCNGWKRSEVEYYFGIEIDAKARGLTALGPKGIMIWIESSKFIGALAHESVHAAKFLFYQKGVTASNENDEPLAYLVQFIFENCYKKIKGKR
jgi:hypothetical protein